MYTFLGAGADSRGSIGLISTPHQILMALGRTPSGMRAKLGTHWVLIPVPREPIGYWDISGKIVLGAQGLPTWDR